MAGRISVAFPVILGCIVSVSSTPSSLIHFSCEFRMHLVVPCSYKALQTAKPEDKTVPNAKYFFQKLHF